MAQRTLTLWALIGVRQYNGSLVDQLALFHDETFLWHYSVPPKRQEILYQIRNGNRVRFLSRFFLSQAKIELEFSEIRLLSSGDQLVYTDSKEYTYSWVTSMWDTHVHNLEFSLINPHVFTLPVTIDPLFLSPLTPPPFSEVTPLVSPCYSPFESPPFAQFVAPVLLALLSMISFAFNLS